MSDIEDEAEKGPEAKDDEWDEEWDDEPRRGRDMTLVYAVVAAAIVIVLAVVLTRPSGDESAAAESAKTVTTAEGTDAPPDKAWQGDVGDAVGESGADAQARATAAPGVYIWTDFGGFHIRSNGTEAVEVTVAGEQLRQKVTDNGDDGDEDANQAFTDQLVVALPAGDGAEGVGIDAGFSEMLTITVTRNGAPIPASEIFLGGADGVAEANPVILTKA